MQSKELNNLIIARLFPQEDVYDRLKEICRQHKVKTAVVLSGIGQLAEFELGFFKEKGNYLPEKFTKPAEILTLNGLASLRDGGYEFHLHSSLSMSDKSVVGGHFINGKVSITLEIVLLKTDLAIKRGTEKATGLRGLFLN